MTVPLTKQEVCRTVLSVLGNRDSAVNNICKMASPWQKTCYALVKDRFFRLETKEWLSCDRFGSFVNLLPTISLRYNPEHILKVIKFANDLEAIETKSSIQLPWMKLYFKGSFTKERRKETHRYQGPTIHGHFVGGASINTFAFLPMVQESPYNHHQ